MKSRLILLGLCLACFGGLSGREIYVLDGAKDGNGTSAAPYDSLQLAVNMAQPGDVVILKKTSYRQGFFSVRGGTAAAPITIRAESKWAASLRPMGRIATINHPFIILDGLVMDGDFVHDDLVKIQDNGHYAILRNCEIRNTQKDCIDMDSPKGVLIEGCLIHHSLNPESGRKDAHGIVAGAVRDLTIRNTRIHSFSGDALQLDPARRAPGWDNILVEGCTFWLTKGVKGAPGFGNVAPGENAIDTKVWPECPFTPKLVVRNTTATGFRNGIIDNMAAFNLKEKIDATLDGVTVGESQHAFRIRGEHLPDTPGGAKVTVVNSVIYDCDTGFRIEDNPPDTKICNITFGKKVSKLVELVESDKASISVQNVLILGKGQVDGVTAVNVQNVDDSAFVNAGSHDYHLSAKSAAIDKGISVLAVRGDRDGNMRTGAPDNGAYEWAEQILRERRALTADQFKPPTGLQTSIKIGKEGKHAVALAWADNSANEDGYEIERSEDAGKTWTKVGATESDVTSAGDGKVKSGTVYLYRVRGFNKDSFSPYSESAPITTEAASSVPESPFGITITSDRRTAELSWLDRAMNEDGYEIERSIDGAKTFTLIATQRANATSFKDKELREHTVCYYRVRSFNSAGKSEYTDVLMATGNRNADKKKAGGDAPTVKRLGE
jgi:hypothetical protein